MKRKVQRTGILVGRIIAMKRKVQRTGKFVALTISWKGGGAAHRNNGVIKAITFE